MSDALTPEQQLAVERRDGPLALAANAGSGKTSVLVQRYVRSVIEDGIAPSRILAITFTDRAAGELRERIRLALATAGRRDAAHESLAAFISTFHGFCMRVLRAHAALAGLPPDFAVLGDAQAAELRDAAFDDAATRWIEQPEALELAAAFGVGDLREAILAVYDELRSRGEATPTLPAPHPRIQPGEAAERLRRAAATVAAELGAAEPSKSIERALGRLEDCAALLASEGPVAPAAVADLALRNGSSALASAACGAYEDARSDYEHACADGLGAPAVILLDGLLRGFGERYAERKRRRGVVDFDDLELRAGALLREHAEVAALWSERFGRVMVDELQDTNPRQMAILEALERDNLFTVGDEFQSIYGFRHADVALFRARRAQLQERGAAGVLSANFRSRPAILRAVNAVFAERFGESFVALGAGREEASETRLELILADNGDGWREHEEALGVELAPAPLWRRAEARALAQRIDQLIRSGAATPENVVVLLRAATSMWVYEAALADLGHATLATAGGGFFARPEVRDLISWLRALANPRDELALYGVLASPLGACSSDELLELRLRARAAGRSPWEVLSSGDAPGARSAALAARLRAARAGVAARGLGELVAAAVAANGYDVHLATLHSPQRRIANIRKLERLARAFEQREGRDLRRFVAALALGRVGSLRETEAPPPDAGEAAIRLMTIHAAKGLEFDVVCLADLGHGPNDRQPALLADETRVGLRLQTLEREPIDTLDFGALREERKAAAAAEEKRVTYVAMTRARERLILSGAVSLERWGGQSTIAWLGPALLEDLPQRAAGGGGGVEEVTAAGGVPMRLELVTPASFAPAAAPAALAPAALADPMPSAASPMRVSAPDQRALSYTAIAEFERCAYRYHLQRVIGLPDVAAPGPAGEGAAARGTVIHALLEAVDFAAPAAITAEVVAAAAAATGVALDAGEDLAAIAELAGAFTRSPLCARLAAAREVRREAPFAFLTHGGLLLRGFLDAAGLEADGTLLVVDYKSDRVEDARAALERDYAIQRLVYALAGLASGARAVEVAHCFLRSPELLLSERYNTDDREALENELAARLEPLREGRFEVSANPGLQRCGTCPGRARLCSWEEVMTLREPL
ncbi:MAG TPA: UvrD-helicase domain-containing protein [Solirubrobacteraceae bacterium]|nr:UvrD-helicase domain-containing protein [Solirubrobacteraceae bacterium]